MARGDHDGGRQHRQHQQPLEEIRPGHRTHPAVQRVKDDDPRDQDAAVEIGEAQQLLQGIAGRDGLERQVRNREQDHDQGEQAGQRPAAVKRLHELGGRDEAALAADPPGLAADDPEAQGHEAGAKAHDREKAPAVPVAGARGAEHREGRKIGGGHAGQKDQSPQPAVGQEVGGRRGFPVRPREPADGEHDQKISPENTDFDSHVLVFPSPSFGRPSRARLKKNAIPTGRDGMGCLA
jgi:hypothetical protein